MLFKTKGIVLSSIKFRESSVIARVYTSAFGIQSYVVNGVRSTKSKAGRIALFQPLTLLDMVVYHKPRADALQRLSEVRNGYPFRRLPFDMVRTSLAMFMAELMGKCLREEEPNEPLFQFLEKTIIELDEVERGLESFHLVFMRCLAGYLGFGIESSSEFIVRLKEFHYPLVNDDTYRLSVEGLFANDSDQLKMVGRNRRSELLTQLLFYYRVHLESFGEMKSLDVLTQVMR